MSWSVAYKFNCFAWCLSTLTFSYARKQLHGSTQKRRKKTSVQVCRLEAKPLSARYSNKIWPTNEQTKRYGENRTILLQTEKNSTESNMGDCAQLAWTYEWRNVICYIPLRLLRLNFYLYFLSSRRMCIRLALSRLNGYRAVSLGTLFHFNWIKKSSRCIWQCGFATHANAASRCGLLNCFEHFALRMNTILCLPR